MEGGTSPLEMTSSCNFVVVVIVLLFHLVRPSPSFVFGVTENIKNIGEGRKATEKRENERLLDPSIKSNFQLEHLNSPLALSFPLGPSVFADGRGRAVGSRRSKKTLASEMALLEDRKSARPLRVQEAKPGSVVRDSNGQED